MKVLISDLTEGKNERQKAYINLIRLYNSAAENIDEVSGQTLYNVGFETYCQFKAICRDYDDYKERVREGLAHEIVKRAKIRDDYEELKAKFDKLQEAITLFKDGKVSKDELVGILLLEKGE